MSKPKRETVEKARKTKLEEAKEKFTEGNIEAAKRELVAKKESSSIKDPHCEGLYLRISKTGVATWTHLRQWVPEQPDPKPGKRKRIQRKETNLGHFPFVSIGDARLKVERAGGIQDNPAAITVHEAIKRYIAAGCPTARPRSAPLEPDTLSDMTNYLLNDLEPLHSKSLLALNEDAVADIIEQRAKKTPGAARRLFSTSRTFSRWCASRGSGRLLALDPLAGMRRAELLAKEEPGTRILTKTEIRELFVSSDHIAHILQFALLTMQRIGEVRQLADNDDQIDENWWSIPASARKTRVAHRIYLSVEARRVYSKGIYPYSESAIPSWLRRMGLGVDHPEGPWSAHDLRRTGASLLIEDGIAPHIVHGCLGHAQPALAQTYFKTQPSAAMQSAMVQLGRLVTAIVNGKNKK